MSRLNASYQSKQASFDLADVGNSMRRSQSCMSVSQYIATRNSKISNQITVQSKNNNSKSADSPNKNSKVDVR